MRLLFATVLLCLATAALGHGDAAWIGQQHIKNAIGELCCGERDCEPLDDDDIAIRPGGYFIKSLNELVPFHDAIPTPAEGGGRYWRCFWGGERKCFFAPPGSS